MISLLTSLSVIPDAGRGPFINSTIVAWDNGPRPASGMMVIKYMALLFLCLGATFPAFAQGKAPVEIEADHQLEWLRGQNMYRGSGNVTITQGTTVIRGDTAEAHYDAAIGPSAMTEMIMNGHVTITDKDRVIHADHGTYHPATQQLVLTGQTITLNTPTMTVVSHESMEYNALDSKAVARGTAQVTQPGQNLQADVITAFLEKDSNTLQRVEAVGHVLITRDNKTKNDKDIAQAQRGVYDAVKNTVDLFGDVKMTQGANHMEGDHATVNLTTGYSTLKNAPGKGGRVRAIFTSDKAAPALTALPMIDAKKNPEQPYALGVKQHDK